MWWSASNADAASFGELGLDGTLRVVDEGLLDYEGGLAAAPGRRGYFVTRRAATTGNELWYRPWGGGAAVVVPGGLSPEAGVAVSRDRRHLALSTCVERQYVARLRTGAAPVAVSRGAWHDTAPYALDDGHLLVTSDRRGNFQGWVIDLDGGAPKPVTPIDAHTASPSRDGRLVVYAAEAGRGGIAVAAIAGGAPLALTTDPSDTSPAFTADGSHVVFVRTIDGEPWLHVVPAAGGDAVKLVRGKDPAPSPTSTAIVFAREGDAPGTAALLVTDVTGAAARPLEGLAPGAWQRPRFAADGIRLLALRGYSELVELTIDASAPPRVVWASPSATLLTADYAPDGDGVIAGVADYDGDVWLADGAF